MGFNKLHLPDLNYLKDSLREKALSTKNGYANLLAP